MVITVFAPIYVNMVNFPVKKYDSHYTFGWKKKYIFLQTQETSLATLKRFA